MTRTQLIKASPVKPCLQEQTGLWFIVLHSEFKPQDCKQGSTQIFCLQDLLWSQSEFRIHSGLQLGGAPINAGKQEHTAKLSKGLHLLFAPHGEGSQGFIWISSLGTKKNLK